MPLRRRVTAALSPAAQPPSALLAALLGLTMAGALGACNVGYDVDGHRLLDGGEGTDARGARDSADDADERDSADDADERDDSDDADERDDSDDVADSAPPTCAGPCNNDEACCEGLCVRITDNALHCGGCGVRCAPGNTECKNSECRCDGDDDLCYAGDGRYCSGEQCLLGGEGD